MRNKKLTTGEPCSGLLGGEIFNSSSDFETFIPLSSRSVPKSPLCCNGVSAIG